MNKIQSTKNFYKPVPQGMKFNQLKIFINHLLNILYFLFQNFLLFIVKLFQLIFQYFSYNLTTPPSPTNHTTPFAYFTFDTIAAILVGFHLQTAVSFFHFFSSYSFSARGITSIIFFATSFQSGLSS